MKLNELKNVGFSGDEFAKLKLINIKLSITTNKYLNSYLPNGASNNNTLILKLFLLVYFICKYL